MSSTIPASERTAIVLTEAGQTVSITPRSWVYANGVRTAVVTDYCTPARPQDWFVELAEGDNARIRPLVPTTFAAARALALAWVLGADREALGTGRGTLPQEEAGRDDAADDR